MIGQPLLIRELIRNLVDNALQYTPAGGAVTVRVTPDPFGQVVVLQVEDSGPGIRRAERELVFRRSTARSARTPTAAGSGWRSSRRSPTGTTPTVDGDGRAHARSGDSASGQGPGALFTVRFPRRRTATGTVA